MNGHYITRKNLAGSIEIVLGGNVIAMFADSLEGKQALAAVRSEIAKNKGRLYNETERRWEVADLQEMI